MITFALMVMTLGFRLDSPEIPVDETRLLADFRVAASRFHETTSHVRVEHTLFKKSKVNNARTVHLIDGECASVGVVYVGPSGRYTDGATVSCGTRSFSVARKSPDADYSLTRNQLDEGIIRSMSGDRREIIESPYVIGGWELSKPYESIGTFQFTKASQRPGEAGSPVIEANFELKWSKSQASIKGTVKLDPSRQFAILSQEFEATSPKFPGRSISQAVEIEYVTKPGSNIPAKITTRKDKDAAGKYRINNVYEIVNWEYGPISPEMFTLAHYGLGDVERPVTMSPKRRTAPYWFLAVAVVGIIALGITRRITRRRTSTQTTP